MDGSHQLLPAYVARVAASAQPVAPRLLGLRADHFEHLKIATDTLVLVIATQFQPYRLILLVHWRMAVVTTPWPERSPTPAPPLPARLALDDPVATACRGPIGGKAAQGAAPPCPVPMALGWAAA
jgi:hypothetical protein